MKLNRRRALLQATLLLAACGSNGDTNDAHSGEHGPGFNGYSTCGNRHIDPDEECDNGPLDNANNLACTATCTVARCGDGLVGPGETCDDANDVPDDGCDACHTPGDVVGSIANEGLPFALVAGDVLYAAELTGPVPTTINVFALDTLTLLRSLERPAQSTRTRYGTLRDPLELRVDGSLLAASSSEVDSRGTKGIDSVALLYEADGSLAWQQELPRKKTDDDLEIWQAASAGNTLAFIGQYFEVTSDTLAGRFGKVYTAIHVLDSDGTIRWSADFLDALLATSGSRIVVTDDEVVCAAGWKGNWGEPTEEAWLACFEDGGAVRWEAALPSRVAGLSASGGQVLAVTSRQILGFDVATGAPSNPTALPGDFEASTARAQGDWWLVTGNRAGAPTLRVLNREAKQVWASDLSVHGQVSSPTLGNDGRLYAIDDDASSIIVFAPTLL